MSMRVYSHAGCRGGTNEHTGTACKLPPRFLADTPFVIGFNLARRKQRTVTYLAITDRISPMLLQLSVVHSWSLPLLFLCTNLELLFKAQSLRRPPAPENHGRLTKDEFSRNTASPCSIVTPALCTAPPTPSLLLFRKVAFRLRVVTACCAVYTAPPFPPPNTACSGRRCWGVTHRCRVRGKGQDCWGTIKKKS